MGRYATGFDKIYGDRGYEAYTTKSFYLLD